jgi:DNA-binding NarL/FixJ family response regulator
VTTFSEATDVTSVGVLTPHAVVAVGLRTLLSDARPSIRFVEPDEREPDVLLYDVIALLDDTAELEYWVKETPSTVVALTRPLRPDLGRRALECGAAAVVAVSATADDIVEVVLSARAGTLDDCAVARSAEHETRLGELAGLSPRETDVLRMITLGMSNQQIADELFLSGNSIKTYIRNAYRKAGVTTRHQAVAWCIQHGFPPRAE